MRKLELVWNEDSMIHEPKFVYQKENIPTKNKRYRGKNKIPNFQDKVRAKKGFGITPYQFGCVITHRSRFGVNPFLKVANNWS
jgi:hypothetical protein